MPNQQELTFAIKAINQASEVLNKIKGDTEGAAESAESAGGKFGGLGGVLGKLALAAGAAGAAFEIKSQISESIDAFSSLAKQVKTLQTVTGESTENVSRLLFVFEEKGVAPEKATAAIAKFEKAVSGVVDAEDGGLIPAGKAQVKMWQELGINLEDASGKLRPTNDLLLDMADKFKELGPGPEATALALKTFGKAGADMLPVLLLGRDGVKDFEAESDKLGHTLTGSQLDAYKANAAAQKEFSAAMEGVKIQLGAALMPVLAQGAELGAALAVKFNTMVVPAIKALSTEAAPKVKEFFANVQDWWTNTGKPALDNLIEAWKAISPIVIPILKEIGTEVETTVKVIRDALKIITDLLAGDWSGAWKDAKQLVSDMVDGMKDSVSNGLDALKGMASLAGDAGRALGSALMDGLKDGIGAVGGIVEDVSSMVIDAIKSFINDNVIGRINSALDFTITMPGSIPNVHIDAGHIPYLAAGGIVNSPTLAVIGEAGPEAVVPLSRGGMGGDVHIHINALDGASVRRVIPQIVRELAQHDRRAYGVAS